MSDSRIAAHLAADRHDPAYAIARELVAVLPFGVRDDTLTACRVLTAHTGSGRATATVVEAVESLTGPVHLPWHHPEPLAPAVARRMLHVLLATRDVGWPGLEAPLGVRRVAAADLFFDATQTVLADDDWQGPNGVEFALLQVLAGRICRIAAPPGGAGSGPPARPGEPHRTRRPPRR